MMRAAPLPSTGLLAPRGANRLLRLVVIGSALLVLLLVFNEFRSYVAYTRFAEQDIRLTRLAGRIVHFDEVLTTSSRMAVATGDTAWRDRYREYEPRLESVLAEAVDIAPGAERADLLRIREVNLVLVAREAEALGLIEAGRPDDARTLLFGAEYERLKSEYRSGVDGMLERFDARVTASLASARLWAIAGGFVALFAVGGSVVVLWLNLQRSRRESLLFDQLATAERRSTIGRLAASLAHELNQPLAAIVNYTGAARMYCDDESIDSELCRAVQGASEQAQRAGLIVQRMREFTKPGTVLKQRVDVQQAIRKSVQLLEWRSKEKRVPIEIVTHPLVAPILADEVQLQQVIVNLLVNAIDASSPHQNVRVSAYADRGDTVIEIFDSGVGITPENAGRIFEAFFTTKEGGQGLGLAITRDIVEGLGGVIEVQARDVGAEFRVRFPEVSS